MPRYGTFLYGPAGTGALYGATPTEDFNLWTFQVDWLGDLSYAPPSNTFNNEALRMKSLTTVRGRQHFLSKDGFDRYEPGEAVGIFDNSDGRYDPYNTSSPLYPYVEPGRLVRILVKDGTSGTNYGVMRGVVKDIQPLLRNGVECAVI